MKSNMCLTVSREFSAETGSLKKDASVKRYFLSDFELYACVVTMLERGEGEGNDCIAIPLENQVQHGTISLEENYMRYYVCIFDRCFIHLRRHILRAFFFVLVIFYLFFY